MPGQTTSNLSGTVQGSSGAIIPGAHITLTNDASRNIRQPNDSGYFSFASIIPGTYIADVTAPGIRGFRQEEVMINPGDTRSLEGLKLEAGGGTQSVTVNQRECHCARRLWRAFRAAWYARHRAPAAGEPQHVRAAEDPSWCYHHGK